MCTYGVRVYVDGLLAFVCVDMFVECIYSACSFHWPDLGEREERVVKDKGRHKVLALR